MAEDFQFIVTIRGTRRTANKVLERFIDDFENSTIEDSMNGKLPQFSMSVSNLRKAKALTSNEGKQRD